MNHNGGGEFRLTKLPYFLAAAVPLLYRGILPATILDDAYITMRVARNLATGHGAVFNLGQRVFSITNLLWMLLNALFRAMSLDSVAVIWFLGLVSEIILVIAIVKLGQSLLKSKWVGCLASVFLFTNPVFLISSLGGMEIALSLASMAFSFTFIADKKPSAALIVAAIGVWVRFDNFLLLGVVFLVLALNRDIKIRVRHLIPVGLIIVGYIAITWAYYGLPIPVSIIRKAQYTGKTSWLIGAKNTLITFGLAIAGRFPNMGFGKFIYMIIPLISVLGLYSILSEKKKKILPLGVFTVIYILAFVFAGKDYATLFPWYFAPPLIITSLFAAYAVERFISEIELIKKKPAVVILIVAIAWSAVMLPFNLADAREYRDKVSAIRERIYASMTIWLEQNIPGQMKITAGEIGTIGFFAEDDTEIIDRVGLTRPIHDQRLPVQLTNEENVEAIIYWRASDQKFEDISSVYPNYEFGEVQEVMIGIRRDIAPRIMPKSPQLMEIYQSLNMSREYNY